MRTRQANLPLLLGVIVSLAVHVFVLAPGLSMAMQGDDPAHLMPARFDPEDFLEPEPEPPPEPETQLGIDADTPSTLTWVGHDEYERHLAALADLEQAAFTEQPAPPTEPAPPTPEAAPAEPVEPPSESPDRPNAVEALLSMFEGLTALAEAQAGAPAPQSEPERPETETPPEPEPSPEPPTPHAAPIETPPEEGDVADKESDAFSTIEVPLKDIQLGKPLARPGLELKPQRPRTTPLLQLTASPGNPLVEIRFGGDGRPRTARIVESSGSRDIDHVIETSLYRWRASGKELAELEGEQTISITLRLILNPRAVRKDSDER